MLHALMLWVKHKIYTIHSTTREEMHEYNELCHVPKSMFLHQFDYKIITSISTFSIWWLNILNDGGEVIVLMLPTSMGKPKRPWLKKRLKAMWPHLGVARTTILKHMFELTYNKGSHP